MRNVRIRRAAVVLAACTALAVWLTWPLVATLDAIVPGVGDLKYSMWVMAWGTHALVTDPTRLADANVFWPERDALFYGPAALGVLPWFAPIYLLTRDPVLSANAMLLVCFALTGATLMWVVARWTGSRAAGFVAAATFLSTPWLSREFVPQVPHLAALQLFPLIVFLASGDLERWRTRLALALCVTLQCSTDLVYVAPAVLAPLALLAAVRAARRATRRAGLRLAGVIGLSLVALAPVAHGYAVVARRSPALAQDTLWVDARTGTVLPADLVASNRPAAFRWTVVAIVVLGCVLAGRRPGGLGRLFARSRAWRAALFWCVVGFVLTLGMPLRIGPYELPTPHGLAAQLVPALDRLRVPSRLGVASLTGLSLLAGLAFAQVASRLRHAMRPGMGVRVWTLALALVAAERLRLDAGWLTMTPRVLPRAEQTRPPEEILRVLARTPGPVLEVPRRPMPKPDAAAPDVDAAQAFADEQAQAMLDSTYHWHPILNGYSSYFPPGFRGRMELASRLPDRGALAALVAETGLRFVWVDLGRLDGARREAWLEQSAAPDPVTRPALEVAARSDEVLLFRVVP